MFFFQQLMQMINGGINPQQIMQNMLNQNPQIQVMFNQARQSGMSPKEYVMQYSKQNNINIQPLVNALSQSGIRL